VRISLTTPLPRYLRRDYPASNTNRPTLYQHCMVAAVITKKRNEMLYKILPVTGRPQAWARGIWQVLPSENVVKCFAHALV